MLSELDILLGCVCQINYENFVETLLMLLSYLKILSSCNIGSFLTVLVSRLIHKKSFQRKP